MLRFGLAWSWGAKSKIGISVYISVKNKYSQKPYVTLLTVSLSQATSKALQGFCWEIFISKSASASAQVTPSPHPFSLQTLRSVCGKGHPNSQNICFHNTKCSSEKYSPGSLLHLMVVSLSRRPTLSKAPALGPTATELRPTAQNQLLHTSVRLQDVLVASAFPLRYSEFYSNLREMVRGT